MIYPLHWGNGDYSGLRPLFQPPQSNEMHAIANIQGVTDKYVIRVSVRDYYSRCFTFLHGALSILDMVT